MNRVCLTRCSVIFVLVVSFLSACSSDKVDLVGIGATLAVKVTGDGNSRAGGGTLFLFADIYPFGSGVDNHNWLVKTNLNGDSIVRFNLDFTDDQLKYNETSFVVMYELSEEQRFWTAAVCLDVGEYKEIEVEVSDSVEYN